MLGLAGCGTVAMVGRPAGRCRSPIDLEHSEQACYSNLGCTANYGPFSVVKRVLVTSYDASSMRILTRPSRSGVASSLWPSSASPPHTTITFGREYASSSRAQAIESFDVRCGSAGTITVEYVFSSALFTLVHCSYWRRGWMALPVEADHMWYET